MGAFHCPLGAMAPGTAGCIECGLCSAQTKAEYAAASEKLRAYLKSHAPKTGKIRKIAVCGKGGVGKSTVTATFARTLADWGYRVTVIDTDESNPALSRALGIPSPARNLRETDDGFAPIDCGEWIKRDSYTADEVPPEFISTAGNLSLITVGKIEDPFQGCACGMGSLARELMQNLKLSDGEIVIADIEAGVESFGRGVERGVDTVVAVLEPSLDSLELAERAAYMVEGIGISRLRAVLNKSPSAEVSQKMFEMLKARGIRRIGDLPMSADVSACSLMGVPLDKNSDVYVRGTHLLELLLDENEMDHPYEGV